MVPRLLRDDCPAIYLRGIQAAQLQPSDGLVWKGFQVYCIFHQLHSYDCTDIRSPLACLLETHQQVNINNQLSDPSTPEPEIQRLTVMVRGKSGLQDHWSFQLCAKIANKEPVACKGTVVPVARESTQRESSWKSYNFS